jgi:hypothetical protein
MLMAQSNYTLQLDSINAMGQPGDFLLAPIKLTNTTNQGFTIKIQRIERIIPENWSSCFCYPVCLAPFVDSMEWLVDANETITIAPNFNTDPDEPGSGYVVVKISELGQLHADTITCTGSTLGVTAVPEWEREKMKLFPNPANSNFLIKFDQIFSGTIEVIDQTGVIMVAAYPSNSWDFEQDISNLPSGYYLIRCTSIHNKVNLLRLVKE